MRLRVHLRRLRRWGRVNLGWLIVVGLALWTGYSFGGVDRLREFEQTEWEGERRVWVGRNGPEGFVLRGDPFSVAAAREAIQGWWVTRCAWGAGWPEIGSE